MSRKQRPPKVHRVRVIERRPSPDDRLPIKVAASMIGMTERQFWNAGIPMSSNASGSEMFVRRRWLDKWLANRLPVEPVVRDAPNHYAAVFDVWKKREKVDSRVRALVEANSFMQAVHHIATAFPDQFGGHIEVRELRLVRRPKADDAHG